MDLWLLTAHSVLVPCGSRVSAHLLNMSTEKCRCGNLIAGIGSNWCVATMTLAYLLPPFRWLAGVELRTAQLGRPNLGRELS